MASVFIPGFLFVVIGVVFAMVELIDVRPNMQSLGIAMALIIVGGALLGKAYDIKTANEDKGCVSIVRGELE